MIINKLRNAERKKEFKASYLAPSVEVVTVALEEGFATSTDVAIVDNNGNKATTYTNANRWYNPSTDQGVGNEYFSDGFDLH